MFIGQQHRSEPDRRGTDVLQKAGFPLTSSECLKLSAMCKMGPVFSSVNVGQNNPRQYLPPASEGGGTLENLPDTDTGDDVLFLNLVSDFKSNN